MNKNEYLRKKISNNYCKNYMQMFEMLTLVYSQFLAMGSVQKQELNFSDVSSIPVDVMSIMA